MVKFRFAETLYQVFNIGVLSLGLPNSPNLQVGCGNDGWRILCRSVAVIWTQHRHIVDRNSVDGGVSVHYQ